MKLSKYQEDIVNAFKNTKDNLFINAFAGCVDCDTEYFNGIEWVRIADYKEGDSVLQYDINTQEASLAIPILYHKYPCSQLWHFETKYGLDQCLCENHNLLCYTHLKAKTLSFVTFSNFFKKHEECTSGYNGTFETVFKYSGSGIDLNDEQIRLMVAVIADGTFSYVAEEDWDSYFRCRFHIKKDRKKNRLRKLFQEANCQWTEKQSSAQGYTDFYIDAPRREKVFTRSYWYNCNQHQLEIICDELSYWDGDFNLVGASKKRFFTNVKETADFVQFVYSACGYRATIKVLDRVGTPHKVEDKEYNYKTIEYTVLATRRNRVGMKRRTDLGKDKVEIKPYVTKDGYKYCFTMPLGTLILRRNGKIFITGNSGKTFMLLELSKYINTYSVFIAFNKSIQEELKTKIDNPKFKTYTFNGLGYQIMINNWEEEQKKLSEQNPTYKKKDLTLDTFKSSEIASLVCADKKDILNLYFLGSTDEDGNDNEEQQYMIFLNDLSHLFDLCRQRMVNFSDEDAIYETVEFYELFSSLMDIPTEIPDLLNKMLEMDIEWAIEGKIDFIDQLYVTYFRVMQKQWKVPYWNQFENIFLDEAQDLSRLQQLFISLIKRPKGRVVAVGDKFQAVYSFAGADCNSVDTLQRLYQTKEYQLPINYRCPQKHLRYVNREFSIPIQPRPDAPEGTMKQIEYENLHSFVEKGDCIISRKNADLCSAALMLLEHDKSVYIRDEKLVDKLISKIMSFKNSINSLEDMDNHINDLRTEQQEAIAKRTEKLIEKGIVDNEQVENTTFSDSAIDLLDCVEILLKNYRSKSNSRNDFSSFVNYVRQMLNTKEKRGAIELTSIHQAKGKEWDRVFILNDARVFYEYAKTPDQIQQEKNLSYVAVTRSKDTLYLVHESEEDIDTEDDDFDYSFYIGEPEKDEDRDDWLSFEGLNLPDADF